jgi:hypothetical protein
MTGRHRRSLLTPHQDVSGTIFGLPSRHRARRAHTAPRLSAYHPVLVLS